MNKAAALLGGIGVGSGLMFFLDPGRGRRRRALVRDKLVRAAKLSGGAIGKTGRDVAHRASGVASIASRVAGHKSEQVTGEVLQARIRSRLGRIVSHPSALDVTASNGRVTLSGPVLSNEVAPVMSTVWSVPGVRHVENRMAEQREPGSLPGLQGGRVRRRFELLEENWSPAWRAAMSALGGTLAVYGFTRHNGWWAAAGAAGATLLARGITNREIRRGFGLIGRRAA